MIEILCFVIIALLIVLIIISIFKKPKDKNYDIQQMSNENNIKMDSLNTSMQNFSQISSNQLQNMNQQINGIYKTIGEMKSMSSDIKDLSKVLTNVKTRGTFGEVQLENILKQTIPNMYEKNVKTNPTRQGQVEFAVKIPNGKLNDFTWLPIDSKFPMEPYLRLVDASNMQDKQSVDMYRRQLINSISEQATKIKNSYIHVPDTTPIAIMYLATESLYLEAVSDPDGLVEKLQNKGIMLAGPSTIVALLNALAFGFNTIAINEKADEVWKLLSSVRQQYESFENHLDNISKKLNDASAEVEKAKNRNFQIQKKLNFVSKE